MLIQRIETAQPTEKTDSCRSLHEALELTEQDKTLAVVGAGGKTNTIFSLAREAGERGRRAGVTTTTHMRREPEHGIWIREGEQLPAPLPWDRHPYLMIAGLLPEEPVKCGSLSVDNFLELQKQADILLVEADGARRLPFKVPSSSGKEPVIPDGVDRILLVMGLSAIGQSINSCACRIEEVCQILDMGPEELLTPQAAAQALFAGYYVPLQKAYPDTGISLILNQADTPARQLMAKTIADCFLRLTEQHSAEKRRVEMHSAETYSTAQSGTENTGRQVICLLTSREPAERI